ncbi:MAG: hypothetical protein N0E42_12105 [Candidatus Thiodiazotropha endolucinida]|nr:hypothetical protein [Candidatus Thiodiazotropha taylori]MCW4225214.1 hypothetical protein [Candidatus Thiodiazotropha endolucinida]MCG7880766.1 hypothetical protein [Candidatus Thiodiazotropha taylori]MCG7886785.1 hypothetical protein [Candidatus Thiodiazotropha taylori]MCG8030602.1 hypothetical protein [Candidatus Thiodiazotropha taylori]
MRCDHALSLTKPAGAFIDCRDKRGRKGDWDVPFRILSVTTLLLRFALDGGQRGVKI